MPKFLTTKATASLLEDIITGSKNEIYLISPFLKLSAIFLERLLDADARGVNIHIVFGIKELRSGEMEKLQRLNNLRLYFSANLHAKCYFNEKDMIITSMNMYDFSEATNREMGVGISSSLDAELYDHAKSESISILKHADVVSSGSNQNAQSVSGNGLDYKNWKDRLNSELEKVFAGRIYFYDNGEDIVVKSKNHNLTCLIDVQDGQNFLCIQKILSGRLFDFLKSSGINGSLPSGGRLDLKDGGEKHYDMAFYTLRVKLKSNKLSYIYPADVATIYHGILSYCLLIDRFVAHAVEQNKL